MSSSQDQMDYDDVGATFRELREYSRGVLDVDHQDVHPVAGLIDDDRVRRVLIWMAENYDPPAEWIEKGMPRNFWDTEFAQRAIRTFATETATKAIANGNLTQAAYMTGLPSYKSDVSGLHAINQLADWLIHSEQCKLVYLAALMGRGKTDLSLTFLEVIHDHYRRLEGSVDVEVPTPEFAANFHVETPEHVDAEVRDISTERELIEWGRSGDSSQVRWFIFDEASTELTAQSGENAQKVAETMAPFVKKMRKMGINMIVIGHDAGDVHVAIRSLADYVDKTGLKTASFYAGVNKREGQGHMFDLAGIPPTSWTFDTDDTADWRWLADEAEAGEDGVEIPDEYLDAPTEDEFKEEVRTRAARVYLSTPDDVTQSDVADAMSTEKYEISRTTVSRAAKAIKRDAQTSTAEAGA